ncbi:hypothetical protein D3C85_255820 [compost metagenome]
MSLTGCPVRVTVCARREGEVAIAKASKVLRKYGRATVYSLWLALGHKELVGDPEKWVPGFPA